MTISFDLDDTLIPTTTRFKTESRTIFQKRLGIEEIRAGTITLIKDCQAKGHKIYIYTTSLRAVNKIWLTFYTYGIRIDKIINQRVHEETMSRLSLNASKYPPAFNIDIHIDDSKGVALEGQRYNFRTIIIDNDDNNWTAYILNQLLTKKTGPLIWHPKKARAKMHFPRSHSHTHSDF